VWKFDPNLPGIAAREGNMRQLLSAVDTPVDYVYGECSSLVDAGRAQRIVGALPCGRGPFAVPNGHHHVMLDQPIALISTLRKLLERGPGDQILRGGARWCVSGGDND
jgi:pimeloyl-ACP methyl ester carboxylesterase